MMVLSSYAEGKKINWKDGVAAIYYILRSNLLGPRAEPWQQPEIQPWEGRALSEVKRRALVSGPEVGVADSTSVDEDASTGGEDAHAAHRSEADDQG